MLSYIEWIITAQEDFHKAETKDVIAIMTQLYFKVGLKQWGDKAHSAAKSDMNQLHLRNTFIPMHRHDMTYEEHQMVLKLHIFFKKKRDGKIKGLTVAGGKKQQT